MRPLSEYKIVCTSCGAEFVGGLHQVLDKWKVHIANSHKRAQQKFEFLTSDDSQFNRREMELGTDRAKSAGSVGLTDRHPAINGTVRSRLPLPNAERSNRSVSQRRPAVFAGRSEKRSEAPRILRRGAEQPRDEQQDVRGQEAVARGQ